MRQGLARLIGSSGLALSLLCAGCGGGDELDRQAVSGTVTLDGQPLALGVIQFQPSSAAEVTSAGAQIKDGSFTIPREDGPTPGTYRVIINSSGEQKTLTAAESSGERMPKLAAELIPPQYNDNTTLTAKVEADKPNSFDFPLTKKK